LEAATLRVKGKNFIWLFTLVLVCLFIEVSHSEITLGLEFSRTLPDSLAISAPLYVTDLDGDNVREFLFKGSGQIFTYSPINDELKSFFRTNPVGITRAYTEVQLDNDSIIDIIEIASIARNGYYEIVAMIMLAAQNYAQTDTVLVYGGHDDQRWFIRSALCEDNDGNEVKELYVEIYYTDTVEAPPGPDPGPDYYYYDHNSKIKFVFETNLYSVVSTLPVKSYEIYPLFSGEPQVEFFLKFFNSSEYYGGGYQSLSTFSYAFYLVDSQVFGGSFGGYYCYGSHPSDNYNSTKLRGYWIGDFVPGTEGIEMFMRVDRSGRSIGPFGVECEFELKQALIYDLSTPYDLDTISIQTPPDWLNSAVIFGDVRFPNSLFNMVDNRLYLFDVSTLSKIDSSAALSIPGIYLGYHQLSEDGNLYAVFRNNRTFNFYALGTSTSIDDPGDAILPSSFELGAPYPNPFNLQVRIPLKVSERGKLKVDVYNVLGEEVESLFDHEVSAGEITVTWDAVDWASGVYIVKARLGDNSKTAKLMLLK
jgi:hypothetical protein